MAEISNLQKKINRYLASHTEMKGKSEAVILSAMQKEGIVTKAEIETAKKTSTFGFGFSEVGNMGLMVETNDANKQYGTVAGPYCMSNAYLMNDVPEEEQEATLEFLQRMTKGANEIIEQREEQAGVVSWCVDKWLKLRRSENAKTNVKAKVKNTETDISLLQKASKGELTEIDYRTGKIKTKTFAQTFKERRGVEYNQRNIEDCIQKAQEYELVKTATEMINHAKSILAKTTKGDVHSQINPEESTGAIIQALSLCNVVGTGNVNRFLRTV